LLNFASQSLHRRLTLLLILVGGCMFLSSYLAFLTYERSALRKNMVGNLRTQALVLSQAIAADLDFGGVLNNVKSMKFLATNKHILAARLFDEEGRVFTSLTTPRNQEPLPSQPRSQDYAQFRKGELDLSMRIYQDQEFKGTLFLRSDVEEIDAQFMQSVKILAISCPAFLLLVLGAAFLLRRHVSAPILELAETTKRISQDHDYALRLRRTQGGEIGALTDAFNDMLGQLQERDVMLVHHQEHLEDLVLERSKQVIQARRLLAATLDALPVYIAILDGDGVVLSTNRNWSRFSEPANPFIAGIQAGDSYRALCSARETAPERSGGIAGPILGVLTGRAESARLEYDFIGADRHRWFTVQATRFVTADTHHTVLMHLEVTDQRLLEIQLRQAQKLESIGQLAAGIAHEINTPTQYIGDNAIFLRGAFEEVWALMPPLRALAEHPEEPGPQEAARSALAGSDLDFLESEVPKAIGECLEGVSRVSRIVSAMRDFSHPGASSKQATDLNRAIESTAIVCRSEWKYVAELVLELDPQLPLVPCLPDEFNQVVLNLIINAAHAITEAAQGGPGRLGTITISTGAEGDHAAIRIRDTGTGIPEAIRTRIFDPFFTTKGVGKGTGQGLAMAYATIVTKHGGTLTVDSEVGQGTTFLLRLPLQAREAQA
jgi:signal transduction histidine kinase/PAS domain-containing protein